jgi:2-polyprenyl-3-methyl-5-hydroxy-6-metoxy-1,4-benzoquinol methylase
VIRPPAALDFTDVDATIQRVRLELYHENIQGALDLVEAASTAHPDPRYVHEADGIRRNLAHVLSREAYVAAQEGQYRALRRRLSLKYLERWLRAVSGRKTRRLIARRSGKDEFRLLEREIAAVRPARVLDGGAGEGGVALAIASRHPAIAVEAVEAAETNVRMARRLNRFRNAAFRQGLIEEVHRHFAPASFDLVYSFAVLEHVRDLEATVASIFTVLRPGGRFCFVVPMLEYAAKGPLPPYEPLHGYCDHVRAFTEAGLRERFGGGADFVLERIPAVEKPHKVPPFLVPIAFGAFFVALTAPTAR